MKYHSLLIENFRGITKLEINDLKRINLIVGRNNSGKSTILESFFLLSGMSNPRLSVNIHNFRDLVLANDEDFSFMFQNLDFEIPIKFSGNVDNKSRQATISPLFIDYNAQKTNVQKKDDISNQDTTYSTSTNHIRLVEGIQIKFKTHKNDEFIGSFSIKEKRVAMPGPYKEEISCRFLNSKSIMDHIDERMENLLVQKKLDTVISVLKGIEPKLTDIRMGARGMIYVDIGAENLMPINIMGDGMRRLLSILTAISDIKNGLLLIDEIESGLHYTSISVAWRAILDACKLYNVQLIATTHSQECIHSLARVYEKDKTSGDDIRLYRVEKEQEKHTVKIANSQVLLASIEKDIEVR